VGRRFLGRLLLGEQKKSHIYRGVDSFDQSQIVSDGKAKIVAPEASDSPLIGLMAHENLQTARELFAKIGAASDVIVFAGDICDHIRNLNPREYKNPEGKTSVLWNSLRYRKNYENDRQTYPRFIDAMMALAVKFAFIDGYILVKMMVSFMEVAPSTVLKVDLYDTLCAASSKFQELYEKGKNEIFGSDSADRSAPPASPWR
jgi:hypothetical protein